MKSPQKYPTSRRRSLSSPAGLTFEMHAHGGVRRMLADGLMLNLFVGHEAEAGPCNLWLRLRRRGAIEAVPLLGPASPLAVRGDVDGFEASGTWHGLRVRVRLQLAASAAAWFWHVRVENTTAFPHEIDLVHIQDLGLAPYGAIRLNEHYVSHYIDLTPLEHPRVGQAVAARQNQAVQGRHPWAVVGSLRRARHYATDALQVWGTAARAGDALPGLSGDLPSTRLQHEHALAAVQEASIVLHAHGHAQLGFFGLLHADHPAATSEADLASIDAALALPEAVDTAGPIARHDFAAGGCATLFTTAAKLRSRELEPAELDTLFGLRRHEEREGARLLSFFHGEHAHVVLRAKELAAQRPHGHILRSGLHVAPDETALTSTAWMDGVFHSMLTQGHVSINRFLSTAHSWVGMFRSHGQRIFVELGGQWQQLGVPSAFEMTPRACRWVYAHARGLIEVASRACDEPDAMTLHVRVLEGPPVRVRVTNHVALGGDDGATDALIPHRVDESGAVVVGIPAGSPLAARFPAGTFCLEPLAGTRFDRVGDDRLVFDDGGSRGEPFVCIESGPATKFEMRIAGRLIEGESHDAQPLVLPALQAPPESALALDLARAADIAPWYLHNALVHYLAPRGLEQYSGGGWGTRDVCQGPLELLLALDRPEPVRDLLLRVFAAQDPGGDWPQWFMFFERDRDARAGDSHGDIVFWPLLALARYLIATEDAALLDTVVPYYTRGGAAAASGTLWDHVERAWLVIRARRIAGTHLAAYGHGDWNDSLQPADPALRERLCSAWTVTLHYQVLRTMARAMRAIRCEADALPLDSAAQAVLGDFQRLLMPAGVVTGYALFASDGRVEPLLHPSDTVTGVRYSLLPMMHAVLEGMLTPGQARAHLRLMRDHLQGPDGARLFDRPLPYRGGPQHLFQRAESSAFFGREVGVMYMHAHLRYAQMLAHVGDADALFDAVCKAHPLGLRDHVPSASLRQANCYYSSSDAAFADRYEASRHYDRVAAGGVALDGGWRVYSSGPGIAISLLVGCLLGIRREKSVLSLDPVLPAALDGLRARVDVAGHDVEITYRVGREGCGPVELELDGKPLAFARGVHPYRVGAAEVSMEVLAPRLTRALNRLVVRTG